MKVLRYLGHPVVKACETNVPSFATMSLRRSARVKTSAPPEASAGVPQETAQPPRKKQKKSAPTEKAAIEAIAQDVVDKDDEERNSRKRNRESSSDEEWDPSSSDSPRPLARPTEYLRTRCPLCFGGSW